MRVLVSLILAALTGSPAGAYNDPTHARIVLDAFDYIIAKATTTKPYGDGASGKSDYELVRSVLAPGVADPMIVKGQIGTFSKEIAGYAVTTDRQPDVVLDLHALGGHQPSYEPPFMDRYFFTMFAHFVNVHRPGSLWRDAGYNYLWVEANQRCVQETLEDLFGNLFARYGGAKVVPASSRAMTNFKGQLKSGVDWQEYDGQFTDAIRFVEFWPLTNLAKYWYDAFIESGTSPSPAHKTPYSLQFLAHVLHAVADSTVPYHASGISGCGHRAYEKTVDVLSKKRVLIDHQLVSGYLTDFPYLQKPADVAELIRKNARVAGDKPVCTCDGQTCDCAEALKSPESTAKRLVNLAVASTVACIRIALRDWKTRVGILKASGVSQWDPFEKPKGVMYADLPALILSKDAAADKTLAGNIRVINHAVLSYAKKESSEAEFQETYRVAVDNLAETPAYKTSPLTWGVAPTRQEFAEPTLEQIRDPNKWAAYLEARKRFYATATLLGAGVVRGFLQARMAVVSDRDEKRSVEHGLVALGRLEKSSIDSLKVK